MTFELPMTSLNKPAKLFQRFLYAQEITLDGIAVEVQFANYVNHKRFKWITESKTEHGKYKIDGRIIANATKIRIRTNSQEKIEQYDIVWLTNALFPKGQYFYVAEPVEIETGMFPRELIICQHLALETLIFDKINLNKVFTAKIGE